MLNCVITQNPRNTLPPVPLFFFLSFFFEAHKVHPQTPDTSEVHMTFISNLAITVGLRGVIHVYVRGIEKKNEVSSHYIYLCDVTVAQG